MTRKETAIKLRNIRREILSKGYDTILDYDDLDLLFQLEHKLNS